MMALKGTGKLIAVVVALTASAGWILFGYEFWRLSRSWPPNWDANTMARYARYSVFDKFGLGPKDSNRHLYQALINQQIAYESYLDAAEHCDNENCSKIQLQQLQSELQNLKSRSIPQLR